MDAKKLIIFVLYSMAMLVAVALVVFTVTWLVPRPLSTILSAIAGFVIGSITNKLLCKALYKQEN